MLKLYIDENTKKRSEIRAEGSSEVIFQQLVEAVYKVVSQLNMEESVPKRMELFHGGLLFEYLLNNDD